MVFHLSFFFYFFFFRQWQHFSFFLSQRIFFSNPHEIPFAIWCGPHLVYCLRYSPYLIDPQLHVLPILVTVICGRSVNCRRRHENRRNDSRRNQDCTWWSHRSFSWFDRKVYSSISPLDGLWWINRPQTTKTKIYLLRPFSPLPRGMMMCTVVVVDFKMAPGGRRRDPWSSSRPQPGFTDGKTRFVRYIYTYIYMKKPYGVRYFYS